jgi:16S rRNA (cytosine967-C5)-methyltransferase
MSARRLALEVLRRVEEGGAFASRALDAAIEGAGAIDPRDAALATELVYGTLRRAPILDAALARHSRRPLEELDPAARLALRMGAYQILYLRVPPHAAVGDTVEVVKGLDHGRASGYVNAVLRALAEEPNLPEAPPLSEDPANHLVLAHALPRWIADEWLAWLGPEAANDLAAAMNEPAPLCLRSPRRDELRRRLAAAGLGASPTIRSPDGVILEGGPVRAAEQAAGDVPFQVQDEGAQLVSRYALGDLAPGRRPRVLDACAAPGAKAFHLAEIGAEVVAVEVHPRKAEELREVAKQRKLKLQVICADASRPLPKLELQSFDAVLVDAPCSGLGTLRRHPEIKSRRGAGDVTRLARLQRELVERCATYLKPGGWLTYSVCTLTREEGPALVAELLASGWKRAPAPTTFPADTLTPEGDLLTLPHRHGADGFYAARLIPPAPQPA